MGSSFLRDFVGGLFFLVLIYIYIFCGILLVGFRFLELGLEGVSWIFILSDGFGIELGLHKPLKLAELWQQKKYARFLNFMEFKVQIKFNFVGTNEG